MSKPAARIGDMHVCPMVTPGTPPVPHVGGPVTGPGVPTVLICGQPAAVMGDMCTCVGPPDTIVLGSVGVLIGGKPAARMGDMCAHGGTIVAGAPTVLIGEVSPGAPVPPVVLAPIMHDFKAAVASVATQAGTNAEPAISIGQTAVALQQAAAMGDATALIGEPMDAVAPDEVEETYQPDKTDSWLETMEKITEKLGDANVNYLPGPLESYASSAIQFLRWFRLLPGGDAKHKVEMLWLHSHTSLKNLLKRKKS